MHGSPVQPPVQKERYELLGELGRGGMGKVYLGRLRGELGFVRRVAIKRLAPEFLSDRDFVAMFIDEARLAAHVRHPNVASTIELVSSGGELLLIMDFVEGLSLQELLRLARSKSERIPKEIAVRIACDAIEGLHGVHVARNEEGPLGIVHRDFTPQNVMVGLDGVTRVIDFGIAKGRGHTSRTATGVLRGKYPYMSPEQFQSKELTAASDVYAAGIVLFETLTSQWMFDGDSEASIVSKAMGRKTRLPGTILPSLAVYDPVVERALRVDPRDRWPSAREMARVLERAAPVASKGDVSDWLTEFARDSVLQLSTKLETFERQGPRLEPEWPNMLELESIVTQPGAPPTLKFPPPPGPVTPSGESRSVPPPELLHAPVDRRPSSRGWWWVGGVVVLLGILGQQIARRSFPKEKISATPGDFSTVPPGSSPIVPLATSPRNDPDPMLPASGILSAPSPTSELSVSDAGVTPRPISSRRPRDVNCRSPYTVDARGIRRYRPECL